MVACALSFIVDCRTHVLGCEGHWLGLLHTFETLTVDPAEYDCSQEEVALGDFVSDTPVQKGSSQDLDCRSYLNGNKPLPDTCPDLVSRNDFCETHHTRVCFKRLNSPCHYYESLGRTTFSTL